MLEVSQKVVIKHRKAHNSHRAGDGVEYNVLVNKSKIGSSFRGRSINKGLTYEEEVMYLPGVIGVPATAVQFRDACDTYWKDISVTVPAPEAADDTRAGLILEVGFVYPNEEAKTKGEQEARVESARFIAALEKDEVYEMSYKVRNEVGRPINIPDFILYRYCLVYSAVAKLDKHVNKSPNIRFYMTNPDLENRVKAAALDQRKKAYGKYLELGVDRAKLVDIFYAMEDERKALATNDGLYFDVKKENDVDLCLEKIINTWPDKFLAIANDKHITGRAFVVRCLEANFVRRIANTDRIIYGDNTVLGSSILEAVLFLNDEKNLKIKQELQAKLDIKKPA